MLYDVSDAYHRTVVLLTTLRYGLERRTTLQPRRYDGTVIRRYGGTVIRRYGGTVIRRYGLEQPICQLVVPNLHTSFL